MFSRTNWFGVIFSIILLFSVAGSCISKNNMREEVRQLRKLDDVLQRQLKDMRENDTISIVVRIRDVSIDEKNECRSMIDALRTQAEQSQEELLQLLRNEEHARVLSKFWLINAVLVNVTVETLRSIVQLDIVDRVFENFEVTVSTSFDRGSVDNETNSVDPNLIEVTWGLDRIDAPEVWQAGYNGSGIRVCVLDTGVDVTHPDLMEKLWTDNSSDPTYPGGWIEFDWAGNIIQESTPYDSDDHGTHTSGTVLGGNQSGTAIGVAPAAWLMHGLILPGGSGSFTQCIAGMQWAIDPVDQYGIPAGERADVVSMSWGATGYHDEMIEPIENMKLAGVVPIASIGNSGEGSSGSPGNVLESIAIGATDVYDAIAWFSSGEEIHWPASHADPYVKPDFSAPGVDVYSSVPAGWGYKSGTSMAAPHVAGTVALMLAANRNLTVDDIYEVLHIVADDVGDVGQDVRFGWGIINAYEAVTLASYNCGVRGYVLDANTTAPLDWPAQVNVQGVFWGQQNTSPDGSYIIWLYPGNYTIQASAFGYSHQNTMVEVLRDQWTISNFTLTATPRGIILGRVTDGADHSAIANATIRLVGTPLLPALSNTTGYFWLEAPIGVYSVDFWTWGYKPEIIRNVEVAENQTIILNAVLASTIKVAVLGDFRNQIANLLLRNISAHERDWDIVQELADYDVIIVNEPSDPGEDTFLSLIATADTLGISLVFTNSYQGLWASYGISLLHKYLGDPAGSYFAYWSGVVYYEVTTRHPIFAGWNVGDRVVLIDGGDEDFAWFYGYSGATIADIGSESLGPLGYGVGYTNRNGGSIHLLLAGLAPNSYTNIDNAWTADAKKLFTAAVDWANEPVTILPPAISIAPDNGLTGAKVTVNGSGYAINSDVTIKFDDMPIATTKTDGNGSFIAAFSIPLAEAGDHEIKVFDSYANLASDSYTVIGGLAETNSLALEITEGSLYFRGEVAEFYVLTTINGHPVNASVITAALLKPDKTVDPLPSVQEHTGLYKISFAIPMTAPNGTYALKVEAEANGLNGTSIGSFLVSTTFTDVHAVLLATQGEVAIVRTDMGLVKMNLTQLSANISRIQQDLAILDTEFGEIQTDLATIQSIVENLTTSLMEIKNGIAILQTEIGQLALNLTAANANIAEVKGDIAIIRTDVGRIAVDVAYALSLIQNSNKTLVKFDGDIATLQTEIGEVKGRVISVQDDVAIIKTNVGQLMVSVPSFVGGVTPSIPVAQTAILLFLGAMIILALVLLWSHSATKPHILR